ncbi:MAG: hypothetical protein K6C94_05790 [Candidatus Gastranaerophilales bacterium]|nr:hypothetical protein [Candidatus Gastranaerophilales bacterium]
MFDFSLHNILHSNIFNFVIMVIILYKLAAPFIKKSIQAANDNMTKIVNTSVENKEKALENLEEVKQDYAKTPQETEEIARIAKNTIISLQQKTKEDIENSKKIIEDNANKTIKTETAKMNEYLTKDTVDKSIKSALSKIQAQLAQDENLHDQLIEKAINELEII